MAGKQFNGGLFLSTFSVIRFRNLVDTNDVRKAFPSKVCHEMEYLEQ
jgi:hypothetical protein